MSPRDPCPRVCVTATCHLSRAPCSRVGSVTEGAARGSRGAEAAERRGDEDFWGVGRGAAPGARCRLRSLVCTVRALSPPQGEAALDANSHDSGCPEAPSRSGSLYSHHGLFY